jgi:hypothetical protein
MAKLNSRWGRPSTRYSTERKVERTRFLRNAEGVRRKKQDSPNEVEFCAESREGFGWKNGARVRRK